MCAIRAQYSITLETKCKSLHSSTKLTCNFVIEDLMPQLTGFPWDNSCIYPSAELKEDVGINFLEGRELSVGIVHKLPVIAKIRAAVWCA